MKFAVQYQTELAEQVQCFVVEATYPQRSH